MIEGFLVLADSATTDRASGKIHMLGAGWSLTGPAVPPSAIAGFLRIPWGEASEQVRFRLHLIDEEGEPVKIPQGDGGDLPIGFEGTLALNDAQADHEEAKWVPMNLSFSVSLPPLPLTTGHPYEWIFEVEGSRVASVRFVVRPGP